MSLRGVSRAVVVIAFLVFLGTAFRTAWTTLSTDFPNYYTAAVLVRHGEPLRHYYDWTWFARQMNYAGIENQLGAYTPQTPLTMLPMIGLSVLPPQQAKRVWLVINLMLLAAVVALLARTTRVRWEHIALLLFGGYGCLTMNFMYGQYYVLLLFLIVLTCDWCDRGHTAAGGFLSGVTFGLKLYTGPLLLYFAARRKWTGVAGMLAGTAMMGALAIAIFGWSGNLYYLTHVLPRTLEGGSIDPYNPGVPTLATMLTRMFLREPVLNPSPALDAPWFFFFIRTASRLGLVTFTVMGIACAPKPHPRREFAWFVVLLVLLSTSIGSYTFILLLAPVVWLLEDATGWKSAYLTATYILLNIHLQPLWMFPKVWLLLLLFVVAGWDYWRSIRVPWAICASVAILLLAAADAQRHMAEYLQEPARRYAQIGVVPGSLFSNYPAITTAGLFYQGMGDQRQGEDGYVLRWLHDNRIESLGFKGYAFHPVAPQPEGPVWFELVAHGASTTMRFDPASRTALPADAPAIAADGSPAVSPDGKWSVFTRTTATSEQLWIRNTATGQTEPLAGGSCNNTAPVWELDSSAVIFASDCGRAFGLPVLYRAPIR